MSLFSKGAAEGDSAESLMRALAEQDGFDRAVHVRVSIPDMSLFGTLNGEYSKYVKPVGPASRACVSASSNFTASFLSFDGPRNAMHVRSLSEWAPANIGPYSQAVVVGDTVFLSGVIGLHPATMTMPDTLAEECHQMVRSVGNILSANGSSWSGLAKGLLYVTDAEAAQCALEILERCKAPVSCIATVQVTTLPRNARVEIEIVAVLTTTTAAMGLQGSQKATQFGSVARTLGHTDSEGSQESTESENETTEAGPVQRTVGSGGFLSTWNSGIDNGVGEAGVSLEFKPDATWCTQHTTLTGETLYDFVHFR